jgi:parallel beta-helix repeat protein
MNRKLVLALASMLLVGVLSVAFNVQEAKASGTIYIRADGSIDPPTAPILSSDNITYTFTDNVYDPIVVERSNIIIDGKGYTVQGSGSGNGFYWSGINNVTVKNTNIKNFYFGVYLNSASDNVISGDNMTTNNIVAVMLEFSDNNTVSNNDITNNKYGCKCEDSSYNNIIENSIVANNESGIWLCLSSNNNSVVGNSITNNHDGIMIGEGAMESSNNSIFRNDFINNVDQVYINHMFSVLSVNVWDDGYPSGGNYWSDYAGVDEKSGPMQDQPGRDGIGDTPYSIDADNRDRYPLMSPEHELVVSIAPPVSIRLGSSLLLNATVTNAGSKNETNVEFLLFINNTIVNSTTIPLLKACNSYMLSYLWTPTVDGTYNVTAYARPVTGETFIENNRKTAFTIVVPVGVKAGNWIKVEYTISGWPAGTPYPLWLKVEFLSVEGTNSTIRVTMHMSDGTEQTDTVSVDVVAGGEALGLSGFVIPANLTTGDAIFMSGYGNVTIEGETTRNYAGANRTVIYMSFSQYWTQLTYYWDKQTGVMVEASTTSGGMTATGKATETNMWEATPAFPVDQLILSVLIVIAVVIVMAIFLVRRKKKPMEAQGSET